jgi:FixJ family two-component response regulator
MGMVSLRAPVIAIVDDHDGLREAIAALLESAGYEACGYASAEDFLRSACARGAACLVLDDRLGGMSGVELQRMLGEGGSRIPIVFISAHEDDGSGARARAMQHGAIAFLRKPFNDVEFLSAVRRALRAPVVRSPTDQGAIVGRCRAR